MFYERRIHCHAGLPRAGARDQTRNPARSGFHGPASASKKSVGAARDLRIDIDSRTGDIRALANLVVVDDVKNPQDEIALAKARRIKRTQRLAIRSRWK